MEAVVAIAVLVVDILAVLVAVEVTLRNSDIFSYVCAITLSVSS